MGSEEDKEKDDKVELFVTKQLGELKELMESMRSEFKRHKVNRRARNFKVQQ